MVRPVLVLFLCAFALLSAPPDASTQTCPKTDQCCGNNICDPDDRENCPEDCGAPGCDNDGQCEADEDHGNCPHDCPPPPCEPDGCGGRCGVVSDGCGGQIDCGSCAPPCPNPNGVCELHLGEDPESCPNECDSRCGNNVCQPGERTRCPSDCPPAPECPGACTAGCPALPSF